MKNRQIVLIIIVFAFIFLTQINLRYYQTKNSYTDHKTVEFYTDTSGSSPFLSQGYDTKYIKQVTSSEKTIPPLHRPLNEINIKKIMFIISTIDRGDRVTDFTGDKFDTILEIMGSIKQVCENGYEASLFFVAAWDIDQEMRTLKNHLYCSRTKNDIPIFTHKYSRALNGGLSSKHRGLIKENFENFDFFIHLEDDMLFQPHLMENFLNVSSELSKSPVGNSFFPGFYRYEYNPKWENRSACMWESRPNFWSVSYLGENVGWYAVEARHVNQGGWMATKEQIIRFNYTCKDPFFDIDSPFVEGVSGGVFTADCDIVRVMPIETMKDHKILHMTNNKLYKRGISVLEISSLHDLLKAKAERQISYAGHRLHEVIGKIFNPPLQNHWANYVDLKNFRNLSTEEQERFYN